MANVHFRFAAQELLVWLEDLAGRGGTMPRNDEIATRFGRASSSAGADLVRYLEHLGLIRVHRYLASRVVEIVATGARLESARGRRRG